MRTLFSLIWKTSNSFNTNEWSFFCWVYFSLVYGFASFHNCLPMLSITYSINECVHMKWKNTNVTLRTSVLFLHTIDLNKHRNSKETIGMESKCKICWPFFCLFEGSLFRKSPQMLCCNWDEGNMQALNESAATSTNARAAYIRFKYKID